MTETHKHMMDWTREEVLIEGAHYPKFQSRSEDWCYTLQPLVRPKKLEPIGYHFAGWAKKPGTIERHRIEGNAKTVGECTAICEGHLRHIRSRD
jgi:hypothetical protein